MNTTAQQWRANWLAYHWAQLINGHWAWTRIPTSPTHQTRRPGRINPLTGIVEPTNHPPSNVPTPMWEQINIPILPPHHPGENLIITPTWYHHINKKLEHHYETLRHYANNGTPNLWTYHHTKKRTTPTTAPNEYRTAALHLNQLTCTQYNTNMHNLTKKSV